MSTGGTQDDAPGQPPDLAVAVEQLRATLGKLPADIGKAVRDAMTPSRPAQGPPLSWAQRASMSGLDVLGDAGGSLLGHVLGRTDRTSAYATARAIDIGRQAFSPGAGPSVPPPSFSRWTGQFYPPNPYATGAFGHGPHPTQSAASPGPTRMPPPVTSRSRTVNPAGNSSTTGPNTPVTTRAITAPGVAYTPPPGVQFPNAPGPVGAQARAGWQTAGVQLAKGIASVGSSVTPALGLAAFGLGIGLRAIEAGSDISDMVHYRNASRVAPFSAAVSREMAMTAVSDLHRDILFSHATEATAVEAERSRRRFRESTLPVDSRLGNGTNMFAAFTDSFLATNIEAFNKNVLPGFDTLTKAISRFNDYLTGIDGIRDTGATASDWGAGIGKATSILGLMAIGRPDLAVKAWMDPANQPAGKVGDLPVNEMMTNWARNPPQPINQVKGIGLIKMR